MLNDRPVACQIREPTDPQGDRWHGEAVTDEVFHPQAVPPPIPGGVSRHLPKPPSGRLWRDLMIAQTVQRTSPYPRTASAVAAQEV